MLVPAMISDPRRNPDDKITHWLATTSRRRGRGAGSRRTDSPAISASKAINVLRGD